jgi:hypothetical protein
VLTITSRVLGPIAVQSRPIAELDRPKDGHPAGFFVVRGGAQRSLSEDVKLWQRNLIPLVPIVFGEICLHVIDKTMSDGGRQFDGLADHERSFSTKPGGVFGGSTPSLALQAGQGMPGAPQPQA